jgi:glyoxylase-like metal-dependent hydrolase (beta-lactamase superfamily II)
MASSAPVFTTIDCAYLRPEVASAYLLEDHGEVAFIETNTAHAVPRLLQALAHAGRSPADVRYVIVTHAHLDHAGGASALLAHCPQATLLCHPRAARHLIDPTRLVASSTEVYGAQAFAELYGTVEPVPEARVQTQEDGAAVTLGARSLRFHHTLGHAKHHFVVHDELAGTVFTGDAFGLAYPFLQRAGRFGFPSTSPTDFDGPEAVKAVQRIVALAPTAVCLTHFGGYAEVAELGAQLTWWLERSQAAVEACLARGHPDDPVAFLKGELSRSMEEALIRRGLVPTPAEREFLEMDLDLNAQGLGWAVSRKQPAAGR